MKASRIALLLLLLTPGLAQGAASPWSTNPQSSVRLITPWQTAARSGEFMLGLQFRLSPGWHVYWKNSGDAGFPPSVTVQPAEVLGKPEILWPTPRRFELPGGLVAFGYEGEVVYPLRTEIRAEGFHSQPQATSNQPVTPPIPTSDASRTGDVLHITADLDYLVCQVDCVPYHYTLALDQPLGDQAVADPETAPAIEGWTLQLPRIAREIPGVQTGAVLDATHGGNPELEIRVLGAKALPDKTDLFLESQDVFDVGKPRLRVTPDGLVYHLTMTPKQAGKPLADKFTFAWTVSNLKDKTGKPFSLEARREVPVWKEGSAKPDPLKGSEAGDGPQADRWMARRLLWIFLGAALMSLAPAVLALLAAEVFSLRGSGAGVREGAAAAATGVVGASWGIAGLILLARRAGWSAAWPAQLQEPTVGALLAVAALLLALNLWGLLEIPLAPARPAEDGAAPTGTWRHLLAGVFTAPLALAWPLPLLQEPMGAAFARGPAAVAAAFAVAGFGFALPYLILTLVPAAARALPVPGPWLPRLREGLGFLAGGSALWLLYPLSRQVSPEGLAFIELALLAMGLLAWLRAREGTRPAARLLLAAALVACAAGALWLADHNRLAPRPIAAARSIDSQSNPTIGG